MSAAAALAAVAALVVAGGVLVAIEFALASLRTSEVDDLAARGDRRAARVAPVLQRRTSALGATQVGITGSALLLGALAAHALGAPVVAPWLVALGVPSGTALVGGVVLVLLAVALVAVVLSELVARTLAVDRPLEVAAVLAPLIRLLVVLLGGLVRPLDRLARRVAGPVGYEATAEAVGIDLDDLVRIIAASGDQGSLTEQQRSLLLRAVELGDRRAAEIMIPRPDVVVLDAQDTLTDLREAARSSGHSRFPVQSDDGEVVGSVHIKDLLEVPRAAHARTTVAAVARPMLAVPESEPLRGLLTALRRHRRTSALVIDEYGDTAGIVTLEDVLEELVGDITDEFDRDDRPVRRVGAGQQLLDGGLRLDRAGAVLGIELPEGPYETLAGYLLHRLGRIPHGGEVVGHGDLELVVEQVEDLRITEVRARQAEAP